MRSPLDFSEVGAFLRPDYYDVLASLRNDPGLPEYDDGCRIVTRYSDVREISRDPERFCSSRGVLANDPVRDGLTVDGSILHMDPPRHGEYRRLLNRQFTGRAVSGREATVRARVVNLLDEIEAGAVVDAVDRIAAPLPVAVIADLLGMPEEERSEFRRWSDATIVASDGRADMPPEAMQAVGELVGYLVDLADRKRADPADDVVSLLALAEVGGAPLSTGELVTFNMSLLVAGNETTRHLIAGALLALAEHPHQRAALVADPDRIPAAVEECLRWVTPIQQFGRTVVADTRVGDIAVHEGEFLLMSYAAANRDPIAFGADAERFDAARVASNPNLAFGFGEHLCLGAALARLEARVFLEELLARHPSFDVVEEPTFVASSLVRGYERLPIVFR